MGHHRLATPDLGRIFRGETVAGLSEWQLLERYLECRDEVAFEALVARHGPMVLGVCRRMLADRTDVEDAFQATFLVLVRRARHLGPRDAIGPWLYGVATRVAMRARSEAARRRRVQPLTSEVAAVVDDRSTADREIGEVLDQELSRLPSKYRHPIVLCYLEGQTHEEAARQLKWPIGTVKGRLARARDLLQSRLVRRGLTPAVGALSLALSPDSSAALHRELLDRTVKSSLKLAARSSDRSNRLHVDHLSCRRSIDIHVLEHPQVDRPGRARRRTRLHRRRSDGSTGRHGKKGRVAASHSKAAADDAEPEDSCRDRPARGCRGTANANAKDDRRNSPTCARAPQGGGDRNGSRRTKNTSVRIPGSSGPIRPQSG